MKKQLLEIGERMGVLRALQSGGADRHTVYVLAYHRVDVPGNQPLLDPTLLGPTPGQFREQMELIAREYQPVSAEQMLNAIERNVPLPRHAVLVTVDDGYLDFKENVFPITRALGIRPVLFVPTAFAGRGGFWWDQLYRAVKLARTGEIATPLGHLLVATAQDKERTLSELRTYVKAAPFDEARRMVEALAAELDPAIAQHGRTTLDWDELRELARAGVTIAAHTHTHPILSHISLDEARREVCTSQAIIVREIGQALPLFAYPDGKPAAINSGLTAILKEEGFRMAFTMTEGRAHLQADDLFNLPRLSISGRARRAQFHSHLTPAYDQWKRARR